MVDNNFGNIASEDNSEVETIRESHRTCLWNIKLFFFKYQRKLKNGQDQEWELIVES